MKGKLFTFFFRDFFILVGLAALLASTSHKAMDNLRIWRDNTKWWGRIQRANGDLVGLSHLDFVDFFLSPPNSHILDKSASIAPEKRELYLFGDSYAWNLSKYSFEGLTEFHFIDKRYGTRSFQLDTSISNVLIIEMTERFFRGYFETKQIFDDFYCQSGKKQDALIKTTPANILPDRRNFIQKIMPHFFNDQINQNMEYNLFSYNFIMPLFETKAALNYYLFNRASGDVVISKDRKFLLLKETTVNSGICSSFAPVSSKEVSDIVDNLNEIFRYYKSCGFKKVYLSMIPNAVTILQPEGYNNLIPLIQNNEKLKMGVIDIYSVFRKSNEELYLHGDTHWNNTGKQKYVDLVNGILMQQLTFKLK